MGALVHGHECHGYPFLTNIKHGTNITIETLHRVLLHHFALNNKVPFTQRTLYLQLDNTTKQCKSKYMLAYLALLVAWSVFDEAVLSFLMVGHTHEDIDQMFSRLAIWLRKHNATSRIGFREAIMNAFKPKWAGTPVAENIDSAANISDFLKDYMAPMSKKQKGPEQREGITKFHQFKFTMLQGVVIMRVREWCGDPLAPWTGLTPGSTHHVVFPTAVPTPDDLAALCPPAQRGTKPTDKSYMTFDKNGKVTSNHTTKTRAGVEALIRIRNITGEPKADLHACLEMMESTEPLPFHWNLEMYRVHVAQGPNPLGAGAPDLDDLDNAGQIIPASEGDTTPSDGDEAVRRLDFAHNPYDTSEEDLPPDTEGFTPKPLAIGGIYIVRMGDLNWELAKYSHTTQSKQHVNTHLCPPRIMGVPAIGADGQYHIWVMWLDGISADNHVPHPADKRYMENKRKGHAKGWESIWAAAVDDRVHMVKDGSYMKIPLAQKNNIITRIQSWILVEAEQGQVASNVVLPRPVPKQIKLRPGQHKPKEKPKPKPRKPPNPIPKEKKKQTIAIPKPKSKPAQSSKRKATHSSTEGTPCPCATL